MTKPNRVYNPITPNEIEEHLRGRFEQEGFLTLANLPHPNSFKDMERATRRIVEAIEKNEKIVLIGDYDVDGVVSTTILSRFFTEIGVDLKWIIPDRFKHGYGLSKTIVEDISNYDLAITVDNGISAVEASKLCQKYNIELIITDHHIVPSNLPFAYAIVNQKQPDCPFPYDEVCGAQIAWYLMVSLTRALKVQIDIKSYLELVSIAIIADMMPLKHINRAMVKSGLKLIEASETPPIKAFKAKLNKSSLNSEDVAFQIAPVLNSAGRMSHAKYSVDFLLSSTLHEAKIKLEELISFNENRKAMEQKITEEASKKVNSKSRVAVIDGENWHEGVIGIVSARVARLHKKPTIILTNGKNGDLKGSGRSFGECNLFEITVSCRELLSKFGGHNYAIGLSLPHKNLEEFRRKIELSYIEKNYSESLVDPDILGELKFSYIDFNLINMLRRYEPYGQDNPRPKFVTRNVTIENVILMGKEGEHKRFIFSKDGIIQSGVLFRSKGEFPKGEQVDIVYTLNENYFNGRVSIQLMIEELTLC